MADFDYKKMRDYVSADPEVSKLREKRTLSYKKIDSLKESARKNIETLKKHFFFVLSWCEFHLAISSQAATTPALQSATVMS